MGTTGQSVTLANSIIGVGILAMPFCFQQCGIILATLILVLMGLVSRLSCHFLLKSSLIVRRRNFEYLAFQVFGSTGKLLVEIGIIGFLMGTCIAYFVVVGDLGPQIISKMFNINQSDILRTLIMIIVSFVCVLPLGLLRNVDSLSNVSAATIGFYFCLVIKVIAGVLQCVPIFSMALFCQTQLFEIFESIPNITLEKMNIVAKNAINICTGVYFTLGLFGYIAFSTQSISGNILMCLSPTMASDVIKLGFVMSLAFSFPLIIFPCRASLYSFLYKKVHSSQHDHIINHSIPETSFRMITVSIIAVALIISLLLPNIELVLGLLGSTIGVMICVVFPAACFVHVTLKDTNERILAKVVLVLGLIIMVLGTYANLQAAENQQEKYDYKHFTQEKIDRMVEEFFQSNKMDGHQDPVLKSKEDKDLPPPEILNVLKEIINQDSEFQPPNPIPPETASNEEKHKIDDDNSKQKDLYNVKDADNRSHPKNLKGKLDEVKRKLSNGANNIQNNPQVINNYEENSNLEKPKEVDKTKTQIIEDKMDLIKKQKLIETIKQHGEEQKELMKEQKELLHEIIKTNQEFEKKNEIQTNDAKKIAVESIQKIANVAIQSLSGVSDKPIDAELNNNPAPLEKIANQAVQEIAKKAVETIEAIQDINDEAKKVEDPQPENIKPLENLASIIANNDGNKPINALESISLNSNLVEAVKPDVSNLPLNNQNMALINGNGHLAQNDIVQKKIEPAQIIQSLGNFKSSDTPIAQAAINEDVKQVINNDDQKQSKDAQENNKKLHSHGPDEPQSYKQGEDLQDKIQANNLNHIAVQNIVSNIIDQPKLGETQPVLNSKPVENKDGQNIENNQVLNNVINSNIENKEILNNGPIVRQKREAVDCIDPKVIMFDDDKISLMNKIVKTSEDLLPPVDLNDVLSENIAIGSLNLHHLRSLKSYDEKKR